MRTVVWRENGMRYGAAVLMGMLVSLALLAWQGVSTERAVDVLSISTLSEAGVLNTLRWAGPEIMVGLAFAIGARAGLFNVGIEGQMYAGGLAATLVGIYLPGPTLLVLPACLVAGVLGGAVAVWPAEILKRRLGVDEVVTTFMLNFVIVLVAQWVVKSWFQGGAAGTITSTIASREIRPEAELARLSVLSDANVGLFITLALVAVLAVVVGRSEFGFGMRAISAGSLFARYAGVSVPQVRRRAFLLSGSIGGLAGAIEVLGVQHRYIVGFAGTMGIDALMIAILGLYSVVGVLIAGLFFGALKNYGLALSQLTDASSYMVMLVTAVFVLLFVTDPVRRLRRTQERRDD